MKLYKLLFESVDSNQIISQLKEMLNNSSSDTVVELRKIAIANKANYTVWSYQKIAEDFYQQNKNTFDEITKNAKTFQHLGGGTKGNAFKLGNQILKIELDIPWDTRFSTKDRAEKAATDLFGKSTPPPKPLPSSIQTTVRESSSSDESIANYVPMIYDQGTFKFYNTNFNWVIMEKLEIPTNELEMDEFLFDITSLFIDGYNLQDMLSQDPLDDKQKELIKDIGEELRLKSDWYQNLITGMWKLYGKGIRDFHAGNIGIRRSGAEGTLVFFD